MTPVEHPGAATRLVALLGDPVAHSQSPRLHNTAFRAADLDLVYVALRVAAGDLETVLDALRAVGAVGANVTVPHKVAAAGACDTLTALAARTGAVNTLWWQDGALHGDTTDVTGFTRVVRATVGDPTAPAVVLGTGGAARAAAVALGDLGASVTVVGRRAEAAAATAALVDGRAVPLGVDEVADVVADAATVVNATPLGMHGEDLPAPFHALRAGQVAHDLVYADDVTPFVRAARANGAAAHDGRALLAAQAEDAYRRWTGGPPPEGMFAALLAQPHEPQGAH